MTTRTHAHHATDTSALREKVGELGEDLRDVASLAASAGREQVHKMREKATEEFYEARDRVTSWEQMLEACVIERPIKSLMFAVVAGMVIARFWRHG